MTAQIKQRLNECKTTEGASDDDVSAFLAGNIAPSSKGKCLIACMQEAFGLVWNWFKKCKTNFNYKSVKIIFFYSNKVKGGQVQPDVGLKLGQMLFGNGDHVLSALEKVHIECAPINNPDRCELAFMRMSCARDTAKKNGLNPPREMIWNHQIDMNY